MLCEYDLLRDMLVADSTEHLPVGLRLSLRSLQKFCPGGADELMARLAVSKAGCLKKAEQLHDALSALEVTVSTFFARLALLLKGTGQATALTGVTVPQGLAKPRSGGLKPSLNTATKMEHTEVELFSLPRCKRGVRGVGSADRPSNGR